MKEFDKQNELLKWKWKWKWKRRAEWSKKRKDLKGKKNRFSSNVCQRVYSPLNRLIIVQIKIFHMAAQIQLQNMEVLDHFHHLLTSWSNRIPCTITSSFRSHCICLKSQSSMASSMINCSICFDIQKTCLLQWGSRNLK